jgi:hypothetical protein
LSSRGLLLTILLVVPVAVATGTPSIEVTTDPVQLDIDETGLSSGAGSGFEAWFETAADAQSIDVRFPSGNWEVYVSRSDSSWDSDLHLYVRRTGDGWSLSGTISGGTSYQEVTTSELSFYSGTGGRYAVPVQYQVTGSYIDLGIGPGTYTTTITYTLYDDL